MKAGAERSGALVILTGASGSGKTAIAMEIEERHPDVAVFRADTIGVPSAEVMASYGSGHQPGGAWQRWMTLEWMKKIAPVVATGRPVLFEGQMRLAFIREALAAEEIEHARIVLVECDEATRTARLTHDRMQPELANESMMGWSRYLHEEAVALGCEVLDNGSLTLAESVEKVLSYLR